MGGLGLADEAAEGHVDGRRVEGRPEEQEEGLGDKGVEGPLGRLVGGDDTGKVAGALDLRAGRGQPGRLPSLVGVGWSGEEGSATYGDSRRQRE